MRTVLDMDEKVVALAKLKAAQQGKSLDALVEEGLRIALQFPTSSTNFPSTMVAEPLDADDPFFQALDEIRQSGRIPVDNRTIALEP